MSRKVHCGIEKSIRCRQLTAPLSVQSVRPRCCHLFCASQNRVKSSRFHAILIVDVAGKAGIGRWVLTEYLEATGVVVYRRSLSEPAGRSVLSEAFMRAQGSYDVIGGFMQHVNKPRSSNDPSEATVSDTGSFIARGGRTLHRMTREPECNSVKPNAQLDHWFSGAADATNSSAAQRRITASLLSLPSRWQKVLWYADVMGEPRRSIVQVMGISPNAVSALLRQARAGLQSAYTAMAEEERPPQEGVVTQLSGESGALGR